jgi:dTDP-4-amino-4,6-dideoxygalactose transaminase
MEWNVPLSDIDFGEAEVLAITEVVRSRWLSMGAVTLEFEKLFSDFIGAKHALAVTNATAALHLACVAVGLGPGDEAIVPSLTFVATANAICYTGATPVFADVESLDWMTISPAAIEACITEKTRAIVVMHYAGFPCDMPAIMEIAKHHGLYVIEDSAHAIGSSLDGISLGTWGTVGCFSFFSNKNMTTGEGGMLVTNDDEIASRMRTMRSHGMTSLSWDRHKGHSWSYDVVDLGFNYRIDEMRSALGSVQLKKVTASNEHRNHLTTLYRSLFTELTPEIHMPFAASRGSSCCHILPVLLPIGMDRTQFMEGMKIHGVQTSIHYPPTHRFRIYEQGWQDRGIALPVTEEVVAREVTLPLFATMTESQVEWVVQSARQALKGG